MSLSTDELTEIRKVVKDVVDSDDLPGIRKVVKEVVDSDDLPGIRKVVKDVVDSAIYKQSDEVIKPMEGRLKAIENDVKEIYKMISELQHSAITDPEFNKLPIKQKLLRLNTELLEAARQVGVSLPR